MVTKNKSKMDKSYESYLEWMTRFNHLFKKKCMTLTKKQYRSVWIHLNSSLRTSHNTPREIARLCGSQNISVYRMLKVHTS